MPLCGLPNAVSEMIKRLFSKVGRQIVKDIQEEIEEENKKDTL